mmetsp:Transcript_14258/g.23749  ORF Transcript_14258/g.23749 Transcript_14258/m.23749 type:complete len:235 (+) Transcript_14258:2-706(+)
MLKPPPEGSLGASARRAATGIAPSLSESQENQPNRRSTHSPPEQTSLFGPEQAQGPLMQTKRRVSAPASKEYTHSASARRVVASSASPKLQLPTSELAKHDISLKLFPSKHRVQRSEMTSLSSGCISTEPPPTPRGCGKSRVHTPQKSNIVLAHHNETSEKQSTPHRNGGNLTSSQSLSALQSPRPVSARHFHKPADSELFGARGGDDPSAFTQKRRVGECTPHDCLSGFVGYA